MSFFSEKNNVKVNQLSSQLAQSAKVVNVDKFGAKGDGVADDILKIQSAIDSLKSTGGVVQFTGGSVYRITKPLVLYDNITLSAYNATIQLRDYEQHFIVNQCYLSTAEKTRNSNINIFGGIYDASTFSGTTLKNLRCIFHHVDNLKIKDAIFKSQSGKYMIALGDTSNVHVSDVHFECASDGIHLLGKNFNTLIENITGTGGDDMVAVTTEDYAQYRFDEGDVKDLTVRNVKGSNATRIVLLGNTKYTIKNVRVDNIRQMGTGDIVTIGDGGTADTTVLVDNIHITHAYGDIAGNRILLRHRNMGEIKIENVKNQIYIARETSGGFVGIDKLMVIDCTAEILAESHVTKMTTVILENIYNRINLAGEKSNVYIKNMNAEYTNNVLLLYGNTAKITLDNCKMKSTATGDDPVITYAGVITEIKFINCNIKGGGSGSQAILLDSRSGGTTVYCKKIEFNGCEIGDHKLIYRSAYTGAEVTTELILANTTVTTTNRLIENTANYNLLLKYMNLTVETPLNELFRFTTGRKISIYGSGWNSTKDTLIGTISADCFAQDFPVKADFLNMIAKGACYNTNATLSCGTGFIMSNGSKWKNLVTDLEYVKA